MSSATGWPDYLDRVEGSLDLADGSLAAGDVDEAASAVRAMVAEHEHDRDALPALPAVLELRARHALARMRDLEQRLSEARRQVGRELATTSKQVLREPTVPRFIDQRG